MKETNVIYIALSELHLNEGESGLPTNPRSIKDEKFKKLVLSVLMFPKMLSLRPIVVNSDNVILGGNMRYNALSEIAGYSLSVIRNKICRKEEYKSKPEQERNDIMSYWADFIKEPKAAVARADDMTLEQQKEFIIKDNSGFGEWDWDLLANEWDTALLEDWGVDVWQPEEPQEEPHPDDFGEDFSLKDCGKAPFQNITFTLADSQASLIKDAIQDIKHTQEYKYIETFGNENSNGNAIYLIVKQWVSVRKS